MFEIWEKSENIGKGVVKNWKMKWIIGRQLPDSPPPQQGASDPISGLTGLCVYLFHPVIYSFPNQHHFPQILTSLPP